MKRRRIQSRQKKSGSWQRDPEGMRMRIMRAATAEFARYGFGGARLDRIAKTAGANKRMIYYHVGDKEGLYLAVLEGAYDHIRAAEHSRSGTLRRRAKLAVKRWRLSSAETPRSPDRS